MQKGKNSALMILARFDRCKMGNSDEFDSKFEEIISKESFEEPDLNKIAINEISETLSSVTFLSAQLSHLMNEIFNSMDVEITTSFLELLGKVKEASELFNDEIQIDIVFNDNDEDDDNEEDEEYPEEEGI